MDIEKIIEKIRNGEELTADELAFAIEDFDNFYHDVIKIARMILNISRLEEFEKVSQN